MRWSRWRWDGWSIANRLGGARRWRWSSSSRGSRSSNDIPATRWPASTASQFGAERSAHHAEAGDEEKQLHQKYGDARTAAKRLEGFLDLGIGGILELGLKDLNAARSVEDNHERGEEHGDDGEHHDAGDPAHAESGSDVQKVPGAAAVKEDREVAGPQPHHYIEDGHPTQQGRQDGRGEGDAHGHRIAKIHGQGLRGRGERSWRNNELRVLGDMELGRNEFPLRLSALVAEEGVGRQLRAAGAEFRHGR